MGKRFDFEYIVIGGGVAGITAAKQLAGAGRKVAIVEQSRLGGADVAYRNVPQKALSNFSHLYSDAVAGARFGISSMNLRYNYPTAMHWKTRAIERAAKVNSKKSLEEAGITVIKGAAHFVGPYDIAVGSEGKQYSASKFIIATGSTLNTDGITGVENVPYYTASSILNIPRVPKTALVVGGGASGCEVAQYLAELGTKVVLVEMEASILPSEDEEVGRVIEEYLSKRNGIKFFTKTKVIALERDKISTRAVFTRGGQERTVRVETVVLATGSKPAIDIGLKNAKVSFDKHGIVVDRTLQTSARNVLAAGDVLGGPSSTERATYTAEVAVTNMIGRSKTFVNYNGFMRIVDISPQIASVGKTESELRTKKRKYKRVLVPLSNITASTTADFRIGFLKLLADSQGKLLGATMVGPHAADVLQEISLAIRHEIPLIQIASAPHPANEWSAIVKIAARKILLSK
ncbi:NAD(P)/FAD-dependent oxidoreductase [Candidatus Saccharibacteria bacterium]|nr:NAD(P)/FAD-dependent oxidoreductase [Candidatus Saccharibacteria bacterium]